MTRSWLSAVVWSRSSASVAHATAALRWTLSYVRERQAFGRPVGANQAIRFRLAELVTAVPRVRRLPLLVRPAPTERLRTRVAIKAQTGCDEWCTFCIIPRTRGPLRSYPEEQIVGDVRRQVDRGVREVVLTGVHLGKYGDDRGETDALARLVDRLTAIDGLLRLRLSSVLPVQVTPALVARVRMPDYERLRAQAHLERAEAIADLIARAAASLRSVTKNLVVRPLHRAFERTA